jgi:hypothetical protein
MAVEGGEGVEVAVEGVEVAVGAEEVGVVAITEDTGGATRSGTTITVIRITGDTLHLIKLIHLPMLPTLSQ